MQQPPLTEQTIRQCFICIHNPESSNEVRREADLYLMNSQKHMVLLMKLLVSIYEQDQDVAVRHQALIYLSNIIKRNWNNKRHLKSEKEFPHVKKIISEKIIVYLMQGENIFMQSLYEIARFLAKSDYPHTFTEWTDYVLGKCESINDSHHCLKDFKQIKQVFIQLADRKGFVAIKNFNTQLQPILNKMGELSMQFTQYLSTSTVESKMAKLSKYCDQIIMCIMRMAPYELLQDEKFMKVSEHIINKLKALIEVHGRKESIAEKMSIQKNIKSIIYLMGQVQLANPFVLTPVLQHYFLILSHVICNPAMLTKPATLKNSLLSLRKFIKQFGYYSSNELFLSSIGSKPKSSNYLQLRQSCHNIYYKVLQPDTIEGLMNYLLTVVMGVKGKDDDHTMYGFEEGITYDRTTEKQLNIHVCGILVLEALMERFTELTTKLLTKLIGQCMEKKWTNVDVGVQKNIFSALAVLPRCYKKDQLPALYHFPILQLLEYVHAHDGLKFKFPHLISGWLEIFNPQQVGTLIAALLDFIHEQGSSQHSNMDLLLYSCYSLNKVISVKQGVVDSVLVLKRVFPIAIHIFTQTDNPEILWPLVNLISTLITRTSFDTNLITSSIEPSALNLLIANKSELLIEALCDMFKNFLCVIPRNSPAKGVFLLVYHFLTHHLLCFDSPNHDKILHLWYITIRQFSPANNVHHEYIELFESCWRKCAVRKTPTIVYILEEYMLLGMIETKLGLWVEIVHDFYQEAEHLETEDQRHLKIAILSFQITLITEYSLEKVNSEKLLFSILKDFCTPVTSPSITLQNSLISIINRYILLHPHFFFNYLQTINLSTSAFYESYFKNMDYLTSRTAMKINALALISLFPHFDEDAIGRYFIDAVKRIIPEVENYTLLKQTNGIEGSLGKVQNSPMMRFSTAVLSERKEKIRKKGTFDDIQLRDYFLKELTVILQKLSTSIDMVVASLPQGDWGHRLRVICGN